MFVLYYVSQYCVSMIIQTIFYFIIDVLYNNTIFIVLFIIGKKLMFF